MKNEMTLQECKDQVAIKHYYDTWDTLCPNGNLDGVPDEWVNEVAELYASQFKPSGVKTFTVEDMKAAFEAGRSHESERQFGTFSRFQKTKFDEWIKTRE